MKNSYKKNALNKKILNEVKEDEPNPNKAVVFVFLNLNLSFLVYFIPSPASGVYCLRSHVKGTKRKMHI